MFFFDKEFSLTKVVIVKDYKYCERPNVFDHETVLYRTWKSMLYRCYTETPNIHYERYQNSGITVCKRWRDSFNAFRDDMGERPSVKHSLDRIDNSKGYTPSNCRWATPTQQIRNRRNTVRFTYNKKTQTAIEWAIELKIPYNSLMVRIRNGMSFKDAISKPFKKQLNRKTYPTNNKLTKQDVLKIRSLYEKGQSKSSIARAYNVTLQNVCLIINKITWKHI